MSLLTSTNDRKDGQPAFVLNTGTAAAPVIGAPVVQLCQGGPVADGTVAGFDLLYATAGSGMRMGVAGVNTNCLQIGPTANIFTNVPVIASATVQMGNTTRLEMLAGSVLDFNSVSAQANTLSLTSALPTPIANGATVNITNPVGLVPGVYAITIRSPAGDGQNSRAVGTTGVYVGGQWASGGAASTNYGGFNVDLFPNNARSLLTLTNNSGVGLNDINCDFYLLASFAP